MKALVTGGAGFIGYHLAKELLEHGYTVVLADNFARGVEDTFLKELEADSRVTFLNIDLMQAENLKALPEDLDYIYHLAAIIGVQNVLKRPEAVLHDNIQLLFHLMDFAKKQQNLQRFVFASTSEIYAGTLEYFGMEIPTPESTPLTITELSHPRTSYMLSKIYGEAVLYQSKIPFTVVRPHNFYGPRMGMSHVIPELLRKVYFDEGNGKLEVFSPHHKRTFCYITDAVKMIRMLAESGEGLNQSFNIGNEAPEIEMIKVAKTIQKILGKQTDILEGEVSPGSPERRCPSMKKTFSVTQYMPEISLEEGILRTYEWYRENIFNGKEEGAR